MTDVIVYSILFMTLGFMFWVLISGLLRRSRLKLLMEFKLRLLDRMSAAGAVATVLQSEEGARLFSGFDEGPPGAGLHVLQTAQVGVVLLFAGAGLLTLAWLDSFGARGAFAAFGLLAISIGAGFCASAWLAWRLGRRTNLIEPDQRDGPRA